MKQTLSVLARLLAGVLRVCLACIDCADHLRQHGLAVTFRGTDDWRP